jgi:hypothetical protein
MLGRTRKDVWSDARFERHVELMERLIDKQRRQQDVTVNDVELMERLLNKQQRQHSVTVNDVEERTRRLSEKCDAKDENKSCDVDKRLIEECYETCDAESIKYRLENRKSVALVVDPKRDVTSADVSDSSDAKYHSCDTEQIKCRLENRKSVALVVDPKRDVIVADVSDSRDAHPLRHAAMNAIDAVAHAQVPKDNLV